MIKKKKNYINNKEFEMLIKQYIESPEDVDERLWVLFDLLITNIMDAFQFKVSREDAKQDCFVLILKTLKNFNTDKGSAFNFFTTIIVNHLKLIYVKNKKYTEKINNFYEIKTGGYPTSSVL